MKTQIKGIKEKKHKKFKLLKVKATAVKNPEIKHKIYGLLPLKNLKQFFTTLYWKTNVFIFEYKIMEYSK